MPERFGPVVNLCLNPSLHSQRRHSSVARIGLRYFMPRPHPFRICSAFSCTKKRDEPALIPPWRVFHHAMCTTKRLRRDERRSGQHMHIIVCFIALSSLFNPYFLSDGYDYKPYYPFRQGVMAKVNNYLTLPRSRRIPEIGGRGRCGGCGRTPGARPPPRCCRPPERSRDPRRPRRSASRG